MSEILERENPPAGEAGGLGNTSLLGSDDGSENSQSRRNTQAAIVQPVVILNIRLMQMRELGRRRKGRVDAEAWIAIYAEGLAQRYGGKALKSVLIRDIKIAGLHGRYTDDEIDEAIVAAAYAYESSEGTSAYCAEQIGDMLAVTLKERKTGLTHLGCFEETNRERIARRKAAKVARRKERRHAAGTKPQAESLSRIKPWEAMKICRRTWERRKVKMSQDVATLTPISLERKNCGVSKLRHLLTIKAR